MSFLPIVDRELRVAAQRKGTYRARALWVAVMLGFFAYVHLLAALGSFSAATLGPDLLDLLSSILFAYTLLAGVFYTSDCLGVEHRNGTIGLLFLPPLRSYDVTAGKLAATSLQATYGLLAMVPVLALSMLSGGVTNQQFLHTVLGLFDTLFLSLCLGLMASALFQNARNAMSFTVLMLVTLTFVFPLGDQMLGPTAAGSVAREVREGLLWASPLTLLRFAKSGANVFPFWASFWTLFGTGVLCFVIAGLLTSRWRVGVDRPLREQARGKPSRLRATPDRSDKGERPHGGRSRAGASLDRNPCLWLTMRANSRHYILWILLGFGTLFFLWLLYQSTVMPGAMVMLNIGLFPLYLLHLLFKILLAAEACRRIHEDKKSGLLELLCVTPTPTDALTSAYFQALTHQFTPPAACLSVLNLMTIGGLWISWIGTVAPDDSEMIIFFSLSFAGGMVILYFDLHAIIWTGLASGLRHERTGRAIVSTLGWILGPTWGLLLFIFGITTAGGPSLSEINVFAMICLWQGVAVWLAVDLTRSSRSRLRRQFRNPAAGDSRLQNATRSR